MEARAYVVGPKTRLCGLITLIRDNKPLFKKIEAALTDLAKALLKHAEAVGSSRVSPKKSQRASAKLQAIAPAFAAAVHA